jgi:hypothetical protein
VPLRLVGSEMCIRDRLNGDCDHSRASQWVKDNVLSQLPEKNFRSFACPGAPINGLYMSKLHIAQLVKDFCNPIANGIPEFWAYYADYDWVAFCQLFGTMMQLPDNYPMFCMDLKQWCVQLGDPGLEVNTGEHNALEDARWNRRTWQYLSSLQRLRFKTID